MSPLTRTAPAHPGQGAQRLLALALVLCFLLAGCAREVGYNALPRGSAVLAFGDSVTYGLGAPEGADYPTRLAKLSGWQLHNAGVSGDTAQAARERIADAIAQSDPALVIIELGGNDFLRRRPEAAVKEDLRAIVRIARQGQRPVVLVAVPRLSLLAAAVGALSDAPLYRELAGEENLVLVEDVFSQILSTPEHKADQIHPNAQGYALLAEGIAQTLRRSGLLAAP